MSPEAPSATSVGLCLAHAASAGHRRFDLPGALTVTAGATMLVFGLVEGPVSGWASTPNVTAFTCAALLLTAFAVIESRSADPLMPPRLLRNRALVIAVTITFLYMASYGTLPYFETSLLQTVNRMSALQTGLAFIIPAIAIATGTQLGERLTARLGLRTTLAGSFAVGAIGTAVLTAGFHYNSSYASLVPGLVISGLGQGITWTGRSPRTPTDLLPWLGREMMERPEISFRPPTSAATADNGQAVAAQ